MSLLPGASGGSETGSLHGWYMSLCGRVKALPRANDKEKHESRCGICDKGKEYGSIPERLCGVYGVVLPGYADRVCQVYETYGEPTNKYLSYLTVSYESVYSDASVSQVRRGSRATCHVM